MERIVYADSRACTSLLSPADDNDDSGDDEDNVADPLALLHAGVRHLHLDRLPYMYSSLAHLTGLESVDMYADCMGSGDDESIIFTPPALRKVTVERFWLSSRMSEVKPAIELRHDVEVTVRQSLEASDVPKLVHMMASKGVGPSSLTFSDVHILRDVDTACADAWERMAPR